MSVQSIMGNRCGHQSAQPRFYNPTQNTVISILNIAQKNCENFYFNYERTRYLKSLVLSRHSHRKIRSEGRERTLAIIQVLLQYCDLASLRVGVPQDNGGFWSPTIKWIAEKAGFRQKEDPEIIGLKRAYRAIKDLVDAGYLEMTQRFQAQKDGTYKGLAAIKRISPKLLLELGVSKLKLSNHQKTAIKRVKQRVHAFIEKQSVDTIKTKIALMTHQKERKHRKHTKAQQLQSRRQKQHKQQQIEQERQLIQEALRLAKLEKCSPTEILLKLRASRS